MVLADRCRGLVQKVFSGVGDTDVSLLNLGFFLFPVLAEFDFAAHAPLIMGQPLLMFLQAIERGDETAVTHRGEAGNTDVNTNGRRSDRHRLRDFALGLNTGVPIAANTLHGDIFNHAFDGTALSVTNPTKLWKLDAAIALIKLATLWKAKAATACFLFEAREVSALVKEVFVCARQVFEHHLK